MRRRDLQPGDRFCYAPNRLDHGCDRIVLDSTHDARPETAHVASWFASPELEVKVAMKVGDQVIWQEGSGYSWYTRWGRITAVSKGAVITVQPTKKDSAEVKFKKNKNGVYPHSLRHPTTYELAYRAWSRAAPKVEKIKITRGWHDNTHLSIEYASTAGSPDDIRLAARELEAFATWLEACPKNTSE